jgi:peptide/nickel transport system substrate-binding protein
MVSSVLFCTRMLMPLLRRTLSVAMTLLCLAGVGAQAKTLRYAPESDALSLDPHGALVARTQMVQSWIYEPLVRFGKELKPEPALAESYTRIAPEVWRFKLRANVRFHDGAALSADDVVFSVQRALSPRSAIRVLLTSIKEARKVDDVTVDIVTHAPQPMLDRELTFLFIVSKGWAERNNAVEVANLRGGEGFASNHANGTGPYMLRSREAGHRTVLSRNPNWWDQVEGNVTELVLTPIANDGTRVAALMSGAVDLIEPVPVQDVAQVDDHPALKVLKREELRIVFLGMDVARDELPASSVKGRNPFKDVRVRRALYHAIDAEAIRGRVMRGLATPRATLLAPGVEGYDPAFDRRLPYDVQTARELLAEAGYPDGFEMTLDCPNDRLLADEQICQAIAAMLSQAGIRTTPLVQPSARYMPKLMSRNTGLFLGGWLIATADGLNPINALLVSPGPGRGAQNIGGYANPQLDTLASEIATESDLERRRRLIGRVMRIYRTDVIQVPLHQQWLAWGLREQIDAVQPPDNMMRPQWITMH